jgi:mRNA-degrading endonuclease RelE of RelBE toxin-antitoxin system
MESRTTRQFRRLFSDLPFDVQRQAKHAYRIFQTNPSHPGLQFKKLEGEEDIYSARIGLDYRALAVMKKSRVVWYWIVSHSEYDRLI